jgi:hypothetical protein
MRRAAWSDRLVKYLSWRQSRRPRQLVIVGLLACLATAGAGL